MANKRARQLRREMTDAERRLRSRLRLQQLDGHRFRRQVPIGPYIVDFVCLATGLVIEVDGGQHAAEPPHDAGLLGVRTPHPDPPPQGGRESRRTAWLESRGYRVLRFWNYQVLEETTDVMETIRRTLASSG